MKPSLRLPRRQATKEVFGIYGQKREEMRLVDEDEREEEEKMRTREKRLVGK